MISSTGKKKISKSDTLWHQLKEFINSHRSQTTFTRQEMYRKVGKLSDSTTLDTYRRLLTRLGHISDTGKKGVYVVNTYIPYGRSLREARLHADYLQWMEWYERNTGEDSIEAVDDIYCTCLQCNALQAKECYGRRVTTGKVIKEVVEKLNSRC